MNPGKYEETEIDCSPIVSCGYSSELLLLGSIGVALGVLSGAGVWLINQLIELANLSALQWLEEFRERHVSWNLFLVPVVGALIVGRPMHLFVVRRVITVSSAH